MSRRVLFPSPYKRMNRGVTLLLISWFCGGLLFVLPNQGGAGLTLPQNLMAWSVMAMIALWCVCHPVIRRHPERETALPAGTAMIIVGAVLWSLPLFWTPRVDWQFNAIQKVVALWGMVALYLLLLCTTSCRRLRGYWLAIIAISALMQAGYAFWQIIEIDDLPGGRPYGSFQQVNVLASFLATGLACALWLYLQNTRRLMHLIWSVALVTLPASLVLLQSRAGTLGALLALLILLLAMGRHQKQRAVDAVILIVGGVGLGCVILYAGHYFNLNMIPVVDKGGSTTTRIYLLKLTWALIKMHPVAGNGYGSFESLFGQLAQQIPPGLESATVLYPHNEILYAWAEGGLVAVAGIFCIVTGVLQRLWSRGGARWVGFALLLPITLHMNLEYPLYQSMTHGLTLILLFVVLGNGMKSSPVKGTNAAVANRQFPFRCVSQTWRVVAMVISVGVFVFMITGAQTQQALTNIEQQQLEPLAFNEKNTLQWLSNPYSQYSRLDFDRHVALLVRFNRQRKNASLEEFRTWAEAYLQVHNDPSVYFSLLSILRFQQSPNAEAICHQAKGRWLSDPRFVCKS